MSEMSSKSAAKIINIIEVIRAGQSIDWHFDKFIINPNDRWLEFQSINWLIIIESINYHLAVGSNGMGWGDNERTCNCNFR